MASIHFRLLAAALLVLALFLGVGALALDQAFRENIESGVRESLMGHIYALLGAANTNHLGQMRLPEALPDPRFSAPDSGLYAEVAGEAGSYHWRSPSLVGRQHKLMEEITPGQSQFDHVVLDDGRGYFKLNFALTWEDDNGQEIRYNFAVALDDASSGAQIKAFRDTLFFWLGGAALLLLLVQGAVLSWGLAPLRKVAADLDRIEAGQAEQLEGRYPRELMGLTQGINSLIRSSGVRQERYRNSLGNLAHSLKTPLALLLNAAEELDEQSLRQTIAEQVPRMNGIVQHQLKHAAAAGNRQLGIRVSANPVIERLINTLQKVYRDKGVSCSYRPVQGTLFPGDEGDLMEVAGNLIENAFKYARQQVHIRCEIVGGEYHERFELVVEDDGPGIPIEERERVLHRGARVDQHQPGQGIGLSVVNELARLYSGELELAQSELGGARVSIDIPYH